MCGIFGVLTGGDPELARGVALALLKYSETRGKEAVGLVIHDGQRIEVLKQSGSVTDFLANPRLHALLDEAIARHRASGARTALAIAGHSRLATNGTQSNLDNNQPVITHGSVALHNGIVVNDRALAIKHPQLQPQGELDSEVLAALLRSKLDGLGDLAQATRATFAEIEGSASIAMLFDHLDVLLLATNTGSLFQLANATGDVLAFASERFILQRVLDDAALAPRLGHCKLEQVRAGHAIAIDLRGMRREAFSLTDDATGASPAAPTPAAAAHAAATPAASHAAATAATATAAIAAHTTATPATATPAAATAAAATAAAATAAPAATHTAATAAAATAAPATHTAATAAPATHAAATAAPATAAVATAAAAATHTAATAAAAASHAAATHTAATHAAATAAAATAAAASHAAATHGAATAATSHAAATAATATAATAADGGGPLAQRPNGRRLEIVDHSPRPDRLARCARCILPSTYPFVDFDEHGVCHYCRTWKTIRPKGEQALLDAVEPYRSKDGSPDVIVAFSGGRDSSYGLHYVKTVLGMNPVAFTYDWGMVTDLARRNQARICGKLGVEHIIRSADITAKRRYVRKNVEAWLKRPELGMVTLLMAGDKEFYSHARQLRKETGIKLVIFCTGNMIEDAPYKTGLMGVPQDDHGNVLTGMSLRNKAGMLWYFAKNYLRNPAYINESLVDTANAFWQTFVVKDDFLYLYQYLPWHEDTIVDTIRREYDWEIATDTQTTWRIGDGTAAFYNYIYSVMAGFTEDDVLLSNMLREGMIDRAEALRRAHEFGKPRWPSIREYAQLVGFSAEEALQIINAAPKLY